MLTVSQLANRLSLSRTTILYYERQGLLTPSYRSENGYRWYGEDKVKRLETIISYRSFGLPVGDLKELLDHQHHSSLEDALERQFSHLGKKISELRQQQLAILSLLEKPDLLEGNGLSKERWSEIMRRSGMSDSAMSNWHKQF